MIRDFLGRWLRRSFVDPEHVPTARCRSNPAPPFYFVSRWRLDRETSPSPVTVVRETGVLTYLSHKSPAFTANLVDAGVDDASRRTRALSQTRDEPRGGDEDSGHFFPSSSGLLPSCFVCNLRDSFSPRLSPALHPPTSTRPCTRPHISWTNRYSGLAITASRAALRSSFDFSRRTAVSYVTQHVVSTRPPSIHIAIARETPCDRHLIPGGGTDTRRGTLRYGLHWRSSSLAASSLALLVVAACLRFTLSSATSRRTGDSRRPDTTYGIIWALSRRDRVAPRFPILATGSWRAGAVLHIPSVGLSRSRTSRHDAWGSGVRPYQGARSRGAAAQSARSSFDWEMMTCVHRGSPPILYSVSRASRAPDLELEMRWSKRSEDAPSAVAPALPLNTLHAISRSHATSRRPIAAHAPDDLCS